MAKPLSMHEMSMAFERRKHEQADGVRGLKALCLRYGGPDGSDWGELLAWIGDALESRHQTEVIADSPPSPQFDFDEGTI